MPETPVRVVTGPAEATAPWRPSSADAEPAPDAVDRLSDFDAFVAARGPELLRLATLLTGDAGRAEQLVEHALGRAYLRWGRVRRTGDPESYVRRIVVRRYLSRLRPRRRPGAVPLPTGSATGSTNGSTDGRTTGSDRENVWKLSMKASGSSNRSR